MKTTNNFNTMFQALCLAHDTNNSKAINKKLLEEVGISNEYLPLWEKSVEDLRSVVNAYVVAKHDPKQAKASVTRLRNKIYPAFKALLEQGESKKDVKELHVLEHDVDSLVGYAENFCKSGRGTQIAPATKVAFRKSVESLIGCRIAGNAVLTEEDRDILKSYQSIESGIKALEETLKETVGQIESLKAIIEKTVDGALKDYLLSQVEQLEKEKEQVVNEKATKEDSLAKAKGSYDSVNVKLRYASSSKIGAKKTA